MPLHQTEITVTFAKPEMAARFVWQCQEDRYASRRRAGTVVVVTVDNHQDKQTVLSLADEFGGHAEAGNARQLDDPLRAGD